MMVHGLRAFHAAVTFGVLCFAGPFAVLHSLVTGRNREGLRERLGLLEPKIRHRSGGGPRIWIHAASLGEVAVALSLIRALRDSLPGSEFILSTMTAHGRDLALRSAGPGVRVTYAPLDFAFFVRRALKAAKPDILVFVETEIWPAWLMEANRMGIPAVLANGRISPRSFGSYMKLRPFFRTVLAGFDRFSMIGPRDAERIIAMGAGPEKVEINGNAKYDALSGMADPALERKMRLILDLPDGSRVFVAGSTRGGEEELIFDAYREILRAFPDIVLVIAPRHIKRSGQIMSMAASRGFSCRLRSEIGTGGTRAAQGLGLDTFGELFAVYGTASIVFCGASLVPLGGQNPLEPASWGRPVLYGPFMEDFLDARALLEEAGAGTTVSGPEDLAREAIRLLENPVELARRGELGKKALQAHRRSAARHAGVIVELLDKK